MRVLMVLLLVPLAGCLGDDGAPAPILHPDATAEGNVTVDPSLNNTAPTLVLDAAVDNLTVLFQVGVVDVDGDDVTWTLDTADGNTTQGIGNASIEHVYAEAGNYTVRIHATDGDAVVEAALELSLAAPVVAAPAPMEGQTATGSYYAGGVTLIGCFGDIFGVGYPAQLEGVFYASFEVEPHTIGYDYEVAITAAVQDSPGFAFLDADRDVVASGFMSTMGAGQVPEGAAYGLWWSCLGTPSEGSYASTAPS